MIDRRSRTRRLLEIHIPVLCVVAFALAPYAWMIATSLKLDKEIIRWPITYWPETITFDHYRFLFSRTTFGNNLVNSLVVALGAVAVGLWSASRPPTRSPASVFSDGAFCWSSSWSSTCFRSCC